MCDEKKNKITDTNLDSKDTDVDKNKDYKEYKYENFRTKLSAGTKYYIGIKKSKDDTFKFKLIAKSDTYYKGIKYNNHYYKIYNNASSYEEAKNFCKSLGGHLAIINSENKQKVLYKYFGETAFIGLQNVNNVWTWSNGRKYDYSNFASKNNTKKYVYMNGNNGKWYTADWNKNYTTYICEWDDYRKIPKYNEHNHSYYHYPYSFDTAWYFSNIVKPATTKNNGLVIESVCSNCSAANVLTIPRITSISLKTTSYKYDGKVKKPKVLVKNSAGDTTHGLYYTVKYSNNKNVGKATAKITVKEPSSPYSVNKTLTFTIKPKGTSISRLVSYKNKITVKWKKQTTQTTGYQIQYSTNKKFTSKESKTVTIKSKNTTSKTIKNLKSKKKYYVRIRTYKEVKVNGKLTKICSGWSSLKSVKTK